MTLIEAREAVRVADRMVERYRQGRAPAKLAWAAWDVAHATVAAYFTAHPHSTMEWDEFGLDDLRPEAG